MTETREYPTLRHPKLELSRDRLSSRPLADKADERLKKSLKDVLGFFIGCVAGAAAVSFMGAWAWALPVALAGVAIILP